MYVLKHKPYAYVSIYVNNLKINEHTHILVILPQLHLKVFTDVIYDLKSLENFCLGTCCLSSFSQAASVCKEAHFLFGDTIL